MKIVQIYFIAAVIVLVAAAVFSIRDISAYMKDDADRQVEEVKAGIMKRLLVVPALCVVLVVLGLILSAIFK